MSEHPHYDPLGRPAVVRYLLDGEDPKGLTAQMQALCGSMGVVRVVEVPDGWLAILLPAADNPAADLFLDTCARAIFDGVPMFRPDGTGKIPWDQLQMLRPDLVRVLRQVAATVLGVAEKRMDPLKGVTDA